MGAVVAATYTLRDDWYDALLSADTSAFPEPDQVVRPGVPRNQPRLRSALEAVHFAWNTLSGWGAPERAVHAGRDVLNELVGDADLRDGHVPVAVCTTDLLSGARVILREGRAHDAVYASCALAGIVPPLEKDGMLLADGVYTDAAPVDVARRLGPPCVVVVDPHQATSGAAQIRNGLQAAMRAMEICYLKHTELRVASADVVIRPEFGRYVDTLEFATGTRRMCVAAGIRAARRSLKALHRVLGSGGHV